MKATAASLILASTATLALAAPSQPAFPADWTSDTAQKSSAWEGGTHNATTGEVCCPRTAPNCKIQSIGMSLQQAVDSSQKAWLQTNGQAAILTLYNEKKQVQATPLPGGKGWNCTSYCKIDRGEWDDYGKKIMGGPLGFSNSSVNQGAVTIDGKTYEQYHWYEGIGPIHMEEDVWYVDETDIKHPIPYKYVAKEIPFNGAEIAEGQLFYEQFKPGKPDAALFNVPNLDSCPKASKDDCDDSINTVRGITTGFLSDSKATLYDEAKKRAVGLALPDVADPVIITDAYQWPVDWTSYESLNVVLNQGAQPNADDTALCCASSFGGQCQVQSQYQEGTRYHDYSNNRSRFEGSDGSVTVDDYKLGKSLEVVNNGTHDVCQSFCPIDPDDQIQGGKAEFLDDNATDLGSVTLNGVKAEQYQWFDTILKVIKMATNDFYVDVSSSPVKPLLVVQHVTPWGGPEIGQSNNTFKTFTSGKQPAEKFNIQDVDQCPQNPQCGSPAKQIHRVHMRQLHTLAKYHETVSL